MFGLGPLAFAAPLALIGLLSLPLLWMLLRATPPTPRNVFFAPIMLLRQIARTPESPETTPLWLILLRLFLATLIILGLSRPIWQPEDRLAGDEPLLVILDNSWAGAANWNDLTRDAQAWINNAAMDGRRVGLAFSANRDENLVPVLPGNARDALDRLAQSTPRAWTARRRPLLETLQTLEVLSEPFETVWLSDGLSSSTDEDLARYLSSKGPLRIILPDDDDAPLALYPADPSPEGLTARLVRVGGSEIERTLNVTTIAEDGQALSRTEVTLEASETETLVNARLPLDLRNRIRYLRVDEVRSAGTVQLTSDSWQRPRTGLIEPPGGDDNQPLLSELHYVEGALRDQAELIKGERAFVMASDPGVIVMTDAARSEDEAIVAFVEAGGLLIRFAGPRLAARGDTLLPVPLRTGGRLFGGALAWDEPQPLGVFGNDSPFAGLPVSDEMTIRQQVLAEPGPAINANVWARLEDGTPLVTAERRGEGWIVLFHITASPDWSDLPLSGLFPQMLGRVLSLSGKSSTPISGEGSWSLEQGLDGFGRLGAPTADITPIAADQLTRQNASAETPPGVWTLGATSGALNTIISSTELVPMARTLPGAIVETRTGRQEIRMAGLLLTLGFMIFLADIVIALILSGRLSVPGLSRTSFSRIGLSLMLSVMAVGFMTEETFAQEPGLSETDALDRALEVRFGYIITGDEATDRLSAAGLRGLSQALTARTAIEPGDPRGINLETDPLIFYPLIYWPVTETSPAPSAEISARVDAYLQSGGLIVFDTRDAGSAITRTTPHPGLIRVLESIDIPPLARTPADHVLGRSFYLLDDFPGRYAGGEVWVEADPDGSSRDGTSGVVIGSADWAGAWAVDDNDRPLSPVEGGDFQRERAYRFGINLAMYAMTGNYKADQVHIPAILDRLGGE